MKDRLPDNTLSLYRFIVIEGFELPLAPDDDPWKWTSEELLQRIWKTRRLDAALHCIEWDDDRVRAAVAEGLLP